MIVVRLMGGLGNQLFQYAASRHLAQLNDTELFVDTTFLESTVENTTPREYCLSNFNVASKIADEKLLQNFRGSEFSIPERIKIKLISLGKYNKYKFDDYGFDEQFLKLKGNYYLRGFFQTEKYFKSIESIIREELTVKDEFIPKDKQLIDDIKNRNSVAIHIRRGDYIRNLSSMEAHGLCTKDYYTKSIENMKRELGNDLHFYLITDDAKWVQTEMRWDINSTLIENKSTIEDFYLMSLCKHNIIANSTFSWWAAWLNKNENKRVILPKHWLNNLLSDTIEIAPKNWIVK